MERALTDLEEWNLRSGYTPQVSRPGEEGNNHIEHKENNPLGSSNSCCSPSFRRHG